MQIKSLYPIIVVDDMQASIDFYVSAMGFSVKHEVTRKDGGRVVVLANEAGTEMELMDKSEAGVVKLTPGIYGFRMNVDNVEEAYKELSAKGCALMGEPIETPISINLPIKDKDGVNITLIQHLKK